VLRHFHTEGWRVVVACSGKVRTASDNITTVPFDLAAVGDDKLESAIARSDAVVHCAALLPSSGLLATSTGARELYLTNTQGTYDLMSMAARHEVKRFIFISTANLYDHVPEIISEELMPTPVNTYMLSKVSGEGMADLFNRTSRTHFYSLRISAPYGTCHTAQAVIPLFVSRALAGQTLELMGSGQRQQVFTHVDDIARACNMALNAEASGVYNIAGATPVSMLELAHAVLRVVGDPNAGINFADKPDPQEGVRRCISTARAKRDFGWEPVFDIEQGLARMLEDIRMPRPQLLLPITP